MDAAAHDRAGGHAGAAGERLALDTAFVGAHADEVRPLHLDEVHVRSARAEMRMEAELMPERHDHGFVRVRHEHHGVRHPRVERMHVELAGAGGDRLAEAQAVRRGEPDGHAFAVERGGDDAGGGLEGGLAGRTGELLDVAAEAAGAVAAHLGVRSVGVPELPRPLGLPRGTGHQQHQAIGADAELAMAELGHLLAGEVESAVAVVGHDEVVARPAHLHEIQSHGRGG